MPIAPESEAIEPRRGPAKEAERFLRGQGRFIADQWYPLALDKVRYAGEWVAAEVADDRYLAEDAAEAVVVDYEPLPAVVDMEAALAPDAPLVHEGEGSRPEAGASGAFR